MDIQNDFNGEQEVVTETVDIKNTPKSSFWKFFSILAAILILVGGSSIAWTSYLSPDAKREREMSKNIDSFYAWQKNYDELMKNDTYGGKTPEETLQLLIDALKSGDVELASKYFAYETNENDPNYLTKKKWEDALSKAKKDNRFSEIIDVVSRATPDKSASIDIGHYVFVTRDGKSIVAEIDLYLNKYSGVWKIESM